MSADLQFLEEWIPERMDPGTVFVLENQEKLGHAQNPFVAVMSCPTVRDFGTHYAPATVRRRDDDLRRRRLFSRVPAGWREYLLPQGSIKPLRPESLPACEGMPIARANIGEGRCYLSADRRGRGIAGNQGAASVTIMRRQCFQARMAKLADAADLKSAGRKAVGVQVPLWAP